MKKPESVWDRSLPYAESVSRLAAQSRPDGFFEVKPALYLHMVAMFWRAYRLYDGILILLKAQLPEEAAILARSLFEESLRLQELAADSSNRDALLLGWADSSYKELKGLFQTSIHCGLSEDESKTFALLEAQRQDLRCLATHLNVRKFKRFMSVKDAASRFGRKEDFWTYEWAHESVHGSDAAWIFSRRAPAHNRAGLFGKNDDPRLLSGMAQFSAKSVANATDAMSAIFAWKVVPELNEAVCTMERILEADKNV